MEWRRLLQSRSAAARELIVNGVREIVENYDVDGIHFDDYFYPTTDLTFDAATYQASGSSLTQATGGVRMSTSWCMTFTPL